LITWSSFLVIIMDNTVLKYTETLSFLISGFEYNIKRLLPDLTLINKTFYSEFLVENERLQESYSEDLDNIGFSFGEQRKFQEDDPYRNRIVSVLKRGTTNNSIMEFVQFFCEEYFGEKYFNFEVRVRESVYDFFDGLKTSTDTPLRSSLTSRLFSIDIELLLDSKAIKTSPTQIKLKKIPDIVKIDKDITFLFDSFISSGVRINKFVVHNGTSSRLINYAY
jgi:hypothetical protein